MTENRGAGESEGGGGGPQGPTTTEVARAIARECSQADLEVGTISVMRVTEGVFAVEVLEHGSNDPERFLVRQGELEPQ